MIENDFENKTINLLKLIFFILYMLTKVYLEQKTLIQKWIYFKIDGFPSQA